MSADGGDDSELAKFCRKLGALITNDPVSRDYDTGIIHFRACFVAQEDENGKRTFLQNLGKWTGRMVTGAPGDIYAHGPRVYDPDYETPYPEYSYLPRSLWISHGGKDPYLFWEAWQDGSGLHY